MMKSLRHTSLLASLVAISLAPAHASNANRVPTMNGQQQQDNALIPRDVLFGNPDRAGLRVSPDGTRISFLAPLNDVLNVWVQTIGKDDAKAVTTSAERPIRQYSWAENSEQIIYMQDKGGDENFHIYAVDLTTGDERDLTPFENVQARIQQTDRGFPDHILVGVNNRNPQLHDVWKVNTRTGERELVYQNDDGFIGFVTDSQFNVRMAMRMRPDGGMDALLRDGEEWKPFAQWDQQDALTSQPAGFSRDGKTLYLIDSRDRNTAALYALDTKDADGTLTLVAQDTRADISDAIIDPESGNPQAVASEYLRTEWTLLDKSIEGDFEFLRAVEDGEIELTSRDHQDRIWTVAYLKDDGPVKYYLYDRDNSSATYLFSNRDALEGLPLAKMHAIEITTRDGLKLVSYLTVPRSAELDEDYTPAAPLPMVLLVHGGPWARDSWGYNSMHQWLANRGYAVLSVNYRGSTGFGKEFINAANFEWAGKMHDDLIDAVNWSVDRKLADPDRVAIMGGSYGGYATLVGLTFTPDVFAAGVDIVGPSHVKTLLESIPPYWAPVLSMFTSRVGSLEDEAALDAISPLTKVDQISKPLLIGQGANDPRVKQAEAEQIVAAMQEKNIPVTYVLFPDEGHGFARPENSMAFFAVTEAFLAEHLGGRYQPIDDDVRESSAQVPAGAELIHGLDG
ncbi:MAG: S9 family peptidase [Phycisphaerales bacterium]